MASVYLVGREVSRNVRSGVLVGTRIVPQNLVALKFFSGNDEMSTHLCLRVRNARFLRVCKGDEDER